MSADITTATSHCISVPGPYATYNRLVFIDKSSATNALMLFHGIMVEKGSQKQTIHTLEPATVFCHTFKSHLVLRGAGVCQVGKNISCHHCRLSGQFGLSVDINPYISSFSQYLVIYTATTTRTPTTQYIAFHTWRHQRLTLLEKGHKNQDLK